VKSNSHEAHYTISHIPLLLPPTHIKYSPHHHAVNNLQSGFFFWHERPNFTPTENNRNNVRFIDGNMKHSELNGSKYCSPPSPQITFLLTFCQNLTWLKPDLQQSGSGTSQAMCHKIPTAANMTIRTVQNPFSTVQLFHEYRLPEKPEILNICYMYTTLDNKTQLNNSYQDVSHTCIIMLCLISVFRTEHHWSPFTAKKLQFTNSETTSSKYISILSFH